MRSDDLASKFLADLGGYGPAPGFQDTIAFALYQFSRVGAGWKLPGDYANDLVLPSVCADVPPERFHAPLAAVLELRLLRPLEGFGLAEVRDLPHEPGTWGRHHAFRKASLCDRFLRFDLAEGG